MTEKKNMSGKYYETILDWFQQQILSGELKNGDLVPSERELAGQFGCSRVPVREALRILEYIGIIADGSEGLIIQCSDMRFLNLKTGFAFEITRETIENLFEVRILLESAAASYAAQRHTDEDIRSIRESIREMSEAIENPQADKEELIRASHDFHFRVIAAAKNPVLESLYHNLYELLEISKQYSVSTKSVSDSTLLDHEAILYKIENGNADEAAKYMKYHLSRALKRVLGEYGEQSDSL